jgi:hypothetical protein
MHLARSAHKAVWLLALLFPLFLWQCTRLTKSDPLPCQSNQDCPLRGTICKEGVCTLLPVPEPSNQEPTTDNGSEPTTDTTGEPTTDKGSEPVADNKDGGSTTEPTPEIKPEPRPEPSPEPKPEPRPEPTPEVKPELTPDAGSTEPAPDTTVTDKKTTD